MPPHVRGIRGGGCPGFQALGPGTRRAITEGQERALTRASVLGRFEELRAERD
jgi:hypothetical protein